MVVLVVEYLINRNFVIVYDLCEDLSELINVMFEQICEWVFIFQVELGEGVSCFLFKGVQFNKCLVLVSGIMFKSLIKDCLVELEFDGDILCVNFVLFKQVVDLFVRIVQVFDQEYQSELIDLDE